MGNKLFFLLVILFCFGGIEALAATDPVLEVAVTFDDLPLNGRQFDLPRLRIMTEQLLAAIKKEQVPAIGFVNEAQLYKDGNFNKAVLDEKVALLKLWCDAGLELGNHTFSHPSLNETSIKEYQKDILQGEPITRKLLSTQGKELRYFRYPYLRVGLDLNTKRAIEKFLAEHGYTIAPVTIENSDWMFNFIYTLAKTRGDEKLMGMVAQEYIDYTLVMFDFFERLAKETVGRPIKQVWLLHANELNAAYFGVLVEKLKARGYHFVSLAAALKDEAYQQQDDFSGKAGCSWLHHWLFTRAGKTRLKDEPEPPKKIFDLYEAGQKE